jgi:hypothetical protein
MDAGPGAVNVISGPDDEWAMAVLQRSAADRVVRHDRRAGRA